MIAIMMQRKEVCSALGTSSAGLHRGMIDGRFPKPYRTGENSVRWKSNEVQECIAEASALAEKVRIIFNNWHSDVVRCNYARVKHVGVDRQGWYQVNVAIPFRRDEEFD